jgi:8-oxo-dGTP pyrophosphatase MutT (NUDIX family)
MSAVQKACPVVVRRTTCGIEILSFRHPIAGYQLVKGTVETGETIQHAAERELLEESGIVGHAIDYIGTAQMAEPEQEWHFVVCEIRHVVERWTHRTSDGGGLDFEFFWHPLNQEPDENWHPVFRHALAFIGQNIKP